MPSNARRKKLRQSILVNYLGTICATSAFASISLSSIRLDKPQLLSLRWNLSQEHGMFKMRLGCVLVTQATALSSTASTTTADACLHTPTIAGLGCKSAFCEACFSSHADRYASGACWDLPSGFRCDCRPKYHPAMDEEQWLPLCLPGDWTPCTSVTCVHGACVADRSLPLGYWCECDEGFGHAGDRLRQCVGERWLRHSQILMSV